MTAPPTDQEILLALNDRMNTLERTMQDLATRVTDLQQEVATATARIDEFLAAPPVGPEGPAGPAGPQGPAGAQGDPGPLPDLTPIRDALANAEAVTAESRAFLTDAQATLSNLVNETHARAERAVAALNIIKET